MATITTLPRGKDQNHLAFIAHKWLPNLRDKIMGGARIKTENLSILNNYALQFNTPVEVSYQIQYTTYTYQELPNLLRVCRVYSALDFNALVYNYAEARFKENFAGISDSEIDARVDKDLDLWQEQYAAVMRNEMVGGVVCFEPHIQTHWQPLYLISKNVDMCAVQSAQRTLYKFVILEVCKVC